MSIKIKKGEYTIEVDTEAELNSVLQALGIQRKIVSLKPIDFVLDSSVLIGMFREIPNYSDSYKALLLLKERPNGITGGELIKQLGLSSRQALGGVFGGIGRYINQFGINSHDVYKREYVTDTYRLTENMIKSINEALQN